MPGKNRAFTTRVDPVSPPSTPPPKRAEVKWWRRRVLPPGPKRLFHAAFIAIVGFPTGSNIGAPRGILKDVPDADRPHGRALPAAHQRPRSNEGQRTMPLSTDQQAEIDQRAARRQPTLRATAPALEEILLFQALPVLDHGFVRVDRLHGRRCRGRAGGPRLLRPRHQEGQRGRGLIHYLMRHRHYDAVRDVRDQVPREAADLRGAPVDPPPHRQRERILGALFDPRPRVLHARRPSTSPRRSATTGRAAASVLAGAEAARVLDLLREDAERAYDHYVEMLNEDERASRSIPSARAWRASWRA